MAHRIPCSPAVTKKDSMQLVVSTHVPEQESTSLATMKITAFHMIPELALGQEAGKHDDSNVRSSSQNITQSVAMLNGKM